MEKDEIKAVLEQVIEDQQQVFTANAEMISILKAIATNTETIKNQKRAIDFIIKYKYYGRSLIYLAAFFLLFSLLLSALYCNKLKEAHNYKKTDIQFRYIKLHATGNLKQLIKCSDSLYLNNPDSLFISVKLLEKAVNDSLVKADEKKKSAIHSTYPVKVGKK